MQDKGENTMKKESKRVVIHKARREASEETKAMGTLILTSSLQGCEN